MAIADTFEEALLKAVRGAEIGLDSLEVPGLQAKSDEEIRSMLHTVTDERLFVLYEAIRRGFDISDIHRITMVDSWFLHCLKNIKDKNIRKSAKKTFIYKMVDTCGGEFAAKTPYFYSIHNGTENEALPFIEKSEKPRIVVLGSGRSASGRASSSIMPASIAYGR